MLDSTDVDYLHGDLFRDCLDDINHRSLTGDSEHTQLRLKLSDLSKYCS